MKRHAICLVRALLAVVGLAWSLLGSTAQGIDPSTTPVLRVLTYNVHHGEAMDGRFDYARLTDKISQLEPDVVALQEVDSRTRRAKGVDQAAELGDRLDMRHAFGSAMPYSGGRYGVAILSRFPIEDARTHHLPYAFGEEPRAALEVTIKPDNGIPDFVLVGTHLCHQSAATRREQTRALDALFSGRSDYPVVIAGDFNARPDSEAMDVLLGGSWIDTVAPNSSIDYVLVRSIDRWRVVSGEVFDVPIVSDHDPILTTLQWDVRR